MGVLAGTACACLAASAAACYAPDIHDCELTCTRDGDCAGGQVCGASHLCAARSVACGARVVDAGVAVDARRPRDARPIDAPPDASNDIELTIAIMGMGNVVIMGGASCAGMSPCVLTVPRAMPVTLIAQPGMKTTFEAWTLGPCTDQGATCTFVPNVATALAVRFQM